ncbi:ATP-binding protein [candidate division KSB1 bacterium]|nr:ATP-binding protein [candidate division KSB1 bacterium]
METLGIIAGIAAFFYMAFIGQKTLKEWWRDRRWDAITPDVQVTGKLANSIYHNLPQPDYGQFIGRENELMQVMRLLRPYPHSQHALVTIDGVGGVGKSALALEVAHRYLRDNDIPSGEKFDAIIWTSAKQTVLTAEGIVSRKQVLRTIDDIYTTIAVTLEREDIIKAPAEEQSELIRKALTQQRALLIVDNLETVDDQAVLEFLRELPAPTKAIVTTRHRIDVAYSIRLQGLPEADALKLIEKECEKKGVALKAEEAQKLFYRTGSVPLAMVWSIAQMGFGYDVRAVLTRLGNPSNDIARFCFEGALAGIRGKPAYKILSALSLFAIEASREVLGYVADLPELDRDDGLVELEKLSLVNKHGSLYSFLPLTKDYVIAELAKEVELRNRFADEK